MTSEGYQMVVGHQETVYQLKKNRFKVFQHSFGVIFGPIGDRRNVGENRATSDFFHITENSKKSEENRPTLKLNFLSNSNCASFYFDFEYLTEPYCPCCPCCQLPKMFLSVKITSLASLEASSQLQPIDRVSDPRRVKCGATMTMIVVGNYLAILGL